MRRLFVVYTVGSSRKNDTLVTLFLNIRNSDLIVGFNLSIYVILTDTPCNQLIVLASEIKYKNLIH